MFATLILTGFGGTFFVASKGSENKTTARTIMVYLSGIIYVWVKMLVTWAGQSLVKGLTSKG